MPKFRMMPKSICHISRILVFSLVLSSAAFAQELYIPRNVKLAYNFKIRSKDGKPGPRYFQNNLVHDISITLNPPSRRVTGSQTILYTNNSTTALNAVYLRFEMNVRSPEAMRERVVESKVLSSDVVIDEYSEDGKVIPYRPLIPGNGNTVNAILLSKPLPAGGSRTFCFKWHYDLDGGIFMDAVPNNNQWQYRNDFD